VALSAAASLANPSARTINRIAEADGIAPPLAPVALPHWATARDGSSYVAVSIYPRTLNELRSFCRDFGKPAARVAEWSCVTIWLMNGPPAAALSNPPAVVNTAVRMVQEYDRIRFGWPRHDGKPWPIPALDLLSPEVREEALRVAAETLCDWRQAGRPHLEPHRIKSVYQYLIACPAFRDKYIKEEE